MKIVLTPVTNAQNISTLNYNLSRIQDALNDAVLYRDNPQGEPNQMVGPIDMNGNNLINGGTADFKSVTINGTDLATQVTQSKANAGAAAASALSAANSATNAQQAATSIDAMAASMQGQLLQFNIFDMGAVNIAPSATILNLGAV